MANLLRPRDYYKPFCYPEAYEFWLTQQQSFWLQTEINMDKDISDWSTNLSEDEKHIIGNILKSFVQSEVLIGDYWRAVASVFSKPEISMMATAFSNMETIHIAAYAYLNETLGLTDFQSFLQDKVAMDRLAILSVPPRPLNAEDDEYEWRKKLALSLAVFSGFGEGVALYSAFAILLSFSVRGLMTGVGEIIEFSNRDESLHARGGVWLFKEFMKENQDLKDIKKDIYEAARIAVRIEDSFIDSVFSGRELPNCTSHDLKQFIRQRANDQLVALGLKQNWKNVDKASLDRMKWFNSITSSDAHADFFYGRVTSYAKTDGWGDMWK